MKKVLAIIAMLAIPTLSMAAGMAGDCYDCHTMHNSENGAAVAQIGSGGNVTGAAVPNLLKLDCMACHANNPISGPAVADINGSLVPQVAHGAATALAGGNFQFGNQSASKVHNVKELFSAGVETSQSTGTQFGNPPGMFSASAHTNIFTSAGGLSYDNFSCAGAAGCHGTRNQLANGTTTELSGMAAISGAHHNSYDGLKDATNYALGEAHSGKMVAGGYRFIPGLKGLGNTTARWMNIDANSHNEYYGSPAGLLSGSTSCSSCHNSPTPSTTSSMIVPNNSMSGFCSTCHGNFHSAGGTGPDAVGNGVSGAFLRHPSDYVIPNKTEYAAYDVYDVSAPVARQTLTATQSAVVTPGTDMVMCLSCHQAHGSAYDYILRFDYVDQTSQMEASLFDTITLARAEGGCLACHTLKGVKVQADGTQLP